MASDERLQEILEEVARKLNFKSWTYTRKKISETIENYFGILTPITITGIGINGEERKSLFVKMAPKDQLNEMKNTIHQHYEAEVYNYCTLLPIYKSITNVDKNFIPECYYASLMKNNEVLVLQDMTCYGYRGYKGEYLDFQHVVISLRALAKFHSLSVIYKEKCFKFDVDVMKPYTSFHPEIEIYFKYIKRTLEKHLEIFKDTEYHVYLKNILDDYASYLNNATFKANYLLYGHGDFWRENILFKYENGKPIGACIIDFQKSHTMCPAQDILLFLLGNLQTDLIEKHIQYFLHVYIKELHSILRENGLNEIYSMENLKQDMKVVAPISVAISTMSFSLWLGLQDSDVVKSKNTCDSDHKNLAVLRFKTKVIEMMDCMAQSGYII